MSRSPDTLFVGTSQTQRTKPVSLLVDDARRLTVDLSAYCGIEDTEIGSAAWSVLDDGDSVTSTSPTTGTLTTSAMVTAGQHGLAFVQCTVVLGNGEVMIFLFRCSVTDPQYAGCVDRYSDCCA